MSRNKYKTNKKHWSNWSEHLGFSPPGLNCPPSPPWATGIVAPGDGDRPTQQPTATDPAPPVWPPAKPRDLKHTPPPPWWPDNEPWPPRHWKSHERKKSGFLNRVLRIFVIIMGLMFMMGALGALVSSPAGKILMVIVIVGAVVAIGRSVRKTAAPIAEVMAAADRVAEGDYTVRVVPPAGNNEIGELVEAFNKMTIRLQENARQRRNLFADVAHEMRTPLSVIRGTVEGMMDGVYPRDDDRLQTLLDETELMTRLLDDLRTLSLADAGVLTLHEEPTDLVELIDDLMTANDPRARAGKVGLQARVSVSEPVRLDPVRIRQTLENLIGNALRHTPPGGVVMIDVRLIDCDVVFTVRDTGKGISPEYLPHIFERFWKSADSGGSGLGLAIARGLVEAHGGVISAESTPGQGATLRFRLPAGDAASANPRCNPPASETRVKITREAA